MNNENSLAVSINDNEKGGLFSSFSLHVFAMTVMLLDHIWATLLPYVEVLTCIGRLAFPVFAFMITEGFFHTRNVKKYMLRLLLFAIISEVPFDLVMGSTVFFPFHQNIYWTLLFGLLCITAIDAVKKRKGYSVLTFLTIAAVITVGFVVGYVTMVDYYGAGVVTVIVFYLFREKKLWCFLAQLVCLYILNVKILGGLYYSLVLFGHEFEIVQQGFALFALIPIRLYNGRRGYHSTWFKYFCYAFYPVHFLILYLIWHFLT